MSDEHAPGWAERTIYAQTIAALRADLKKAQEFAKHEYMSMVNHTEKMAALKAEIVRQENHIDMMKNHIDIMAAALAEIKATAEGHSDQPITEILDGCIDEIAKTVSPHKPEGEDDEQ